MVAIQIIMLSGWAGSGKDTAAAYLVKHKGFVRMAFADALKDTVAETRGIPREWMDTLEGKSRVVGPDGRTVRDYLISDGQAARKKDPDVWIKVVIKNIKRLAEEAAKDSTCKVVISDWRLPNEYTTLKSEFASVARVRVNRYKTPPINDYTETALDRETFELSLDNTGTAMEYESLLERVDWEQCFP